MLKKLIYIPLLAIIAVLTAIFIHPELITGSGVSAATAPTTRPFPPLPPTPLAKHALVFSIDGCRPDVLLRSNIPTIRGMMKRGAFTTYAETTDVAITLPSHVSMLTGVRPSVHGIEINKDVDDEDLVYPKVPTLFNLAHNKGMVTAVASTKIKFRMISTPDSIDYSWISKEASSPDDVACALKAADIIINKKPAAMLVHFGNCDKTGHAIGWGTPEQIEAIEKADVAVKIVLDALVTAGIDKETLVILSSDHGGSGKEHGKGDPSSRYIPWIAMGPGIRENYDLTRDRERTVHTEDTFATACYFLGLKPPANIEGRPVMQVFEPPATSETQPK